MAWPDGDVDKLRAAAGAWLAAATAVDGLVGKAQTAAKSVKAISSKESDDAAKKFAALEKYLRDVASGCRTLAKGCTDYADQIQAVHDEVTKILEELAEAIGVTIIVGVIFGAVSAGAGTIAAGCVTAAEAGGAALRIVIIIARVATFAETIGTTVSGAGEALAVTGRACALTVKAVKFSATLAKYTLADSTVNTTIDAIDHGGRPTDVTGDITAAAITSPLGPMGKRLGEAATGAIKRSGIKLPSMPRLKLGRGTVPRLSGSFPINAFPRSENIYEWAKKVIPVPGYYDVAMHGNPQVVQIALEDGREFLIQGHQLADVIQKSTDYSGEAVRLLSCSTGGEADGVAQELADALGVPVLAPTKTLWVFDDGGLVMGDTSNVPNGEWKLFKPRRRQ